MKKEAYLLVQETVTVRKYNPNFGDSEMCVCGHAYYRHFDTYDNMNSVGCKYCGCREFHQNDCRYDGSTPGLPECEDRVRGSEACTGCEWHGHNIDRKKPSSFLAADTTNCRACGYQYEEKLAVGSTIDLAVTSGDEAFYQLGSLVDIRRKDIDGDESKRAVALLVCPKCGTVKCK